MDARRCRTSKGVAFAVLLMAATLSGGCATTHAAQGMEDTVEFGIERSLFQRLDLAVVQTLRPGILVRRFELIVFDDLDGDGMLDDGEQRSHASAWTDGAGSPWFKVAFFDRSAELGHPWVHAEAETTAGVARAAWPVDT